MVSPSPAAPPGQPNAHGNDPLTASIRSLVFNATVPIRVEFHRDDLPASASRGIEYHYLQAPRIAYLALLLADIRRHFVELVLGGATSAHLQDSDLWFETEDGTPLRWHWPIGLLHDLHHLASEPALLPARPVVIPSSLASVFAPLTGSSHPANRSSGRADGPDLSLSVGGGGSGAGGGGRTPRMGGMGGSVGTLRAPSASSGATPRQRTPSSSTTGTSRSATAAAATAPAMNRVASTASSSSANSTSSFRQSSSSFAAPPAIGSDPFSGHAIPSSASSKAGKVGPAVQPWRIVVRHKNANAVGSTTGAVAAGTAGADTSGSSGGGAGVLLSGGHRVDEIRTGFMAMIKEADYVRWGSTKRVMNLRQEQQDSLWEAVVHNDFERYWQVATKLVPLPAPPATVGSASTRGTASTRSSTPSQSPAEGRLPDANGMKHVPIRVYLPEGGGVVQEMVAPLRRDGSPTTLRQALSQLVPLLFPTTPLASSSSSSTLSASSRDPQAAQQQPLPLAYPLIHGVYPPFETEVGWLGACMAGTDGWVSVVLVLDTRDPPLGR